MITLGRAGFCVGLALFVTATVSVVRTLVIPGNRAGMLPRFVDRLTDGFFRVLCLRAKSYQRRHQILTAHAPVILGAQLATWLIEYEAAFSLMLWPSTHQLRAAVREAGSSLLTLGFAATHMSSATVIDFLAAATGLIVVALQIAYLPTLYSSFNRRETEVTLLGVRAGQPPWGAELLARSHFLLSEQELPAFYDRWERWAADVAESHASYPILLRFRSPDPSSSWLMGLLAVMDSAALWSAINPDTVPLQARLCLRMGFVSLRKMAETIGMPFESDPSPDQPIQLTFDEFCDGYQRIEGVGFTMSRTAEQAWPHFRGWRVNYESIVYRLATAIDAVPVIWSGSRRFSVSPLAPGGPTNHTPENPSGNTQIRRDARP